MRLIGYISPTSRLTRARQEHLLREYDTVDVVENDIEQAVKWMRRGRALVVPQLSVLHATRDGIKDVVKRIHERGGFVIEGATGRQSDDPVEAVAMGIDAASKKSLTKEWAKAIATKYPDDDPKLEKARKLWSNVMLSTDEIAERVGMAKNTLRRRLGNRGLPPGARPKRKRAKR